jgi:transcriptional regulator with XRE-family HTH domain
MKSVGVTAPPVASKTFCALSFVIQKDPSHQPVIVCGVTPMRSANSLRLTSFRVSHSESFMSELVALLKTKGKGNFQCDYLDSFNNNNQSLSMAKRVQTRLKTQNRNRRIFLKEWRTYRGLTQEQLAERVGWGVSNVSQLETGRQGYSQDGLERLADALRCDPGHLLSVDPTKNDAIWSIWEIAKPGDRQKIVDIARTIIGKTGTDE